MVININCIHNEEYIYRVNRVIVERTSFFMYFILFIISVNVGICKSNSSLINVP